jgi:hypothetical protein
LPEVYNRLLEVAVLLTELAEPHSGVRVVPVGSLAVLDHRLLDVAAFFPDGPAFVERERVPRDLAEPLHRVLERAEDAPASPQAATGGVNSPW